MFDERYGYLLNAFKDVAELATTVKATLCMYGREERPHEIAQMTGVFAHYVDVMMWLAFYLAHHPEWAVELDRLMEPVGCPALKVPLIEEFLKGKGIRLYDGTPFVVDLG